MTTISDILKRKENVKISFSATVLKNADYNKLIP